jgi:hypothetical protein
MEPRRAFSNVERSVCVNGGISSSFGQDDTGRETSVTIDPISILMLLGAVS